MTLTVKVGTKQKLKEFAGIVIDEHLYHEYPEGSGILLLMGVLLGMTVSSKLNRDLRFGSGKTRPMYIIAIAYKDDVPVGVMCVDGRTIGFYTKPEYRGQGIGKKIFTETSLLYDLSSNLTGFPTEITPPLFFEKLGIKADYGDFRIINTLVPQI